MANLKYDEIGCWSEIKLEIVRKYATAYSSILTKQAYIKKHIYIDAFAGRGVHISKITGEFISGSPTNAMLVNPPFSELHFIDLDGDKADELQKLASGKDSIHIYKGDCNDILVSEVFPRCKYSDRCRALCLLDPYGLHLDWALIYAAGQMRSIEIFLNFPIMDMNRNVLKHDLSKVNPEQTNRMNVFWGDESWKIAAYRTDQNLFSFPEKTENDVIAEAFRIRLEKVAGFQYVPTPMPMRNTKGAVVYYLFFASQNKTGGKIVNDIFDKYRNRGQYNGH